MSKLSTSRLTPSRKKRRQAAGSGLNWLDAMHGHCRALKTLGLALLTAEAEALPPELVTGLGELILREAKAVRNLTDEAGKEAR